MITDDEQINWNPCQAGAGACQNENRALGRLDCGLLPVVETFKDLGHLPFLQLEALPVQKAHIAVVTFV